MTAAIAGLPVVAEHYQEALKTLDARFGKTDSIKSALFTKLKYVSSSKDDTGSLRQKYEEIVFICRQLAALGEDLDHQLLIQTIIGKFPENTMLALTNIKPVASWKYEDLRSKLDDLISAKEDL
uniref:Uncharacterized protein n=1 Tax=Panagrolaimus davidi TaxID=227884 RepID=A0A914Q7N8_9BILA